MSGCSDDIMENPQHGKLYLLPSGENLRHKGTGSRKTKSVVVNLLLCVSDHHTFSCLLLLRGVMKTLSSIPNTLILNILDKSNMLSIRSNHVQCFVCFRYLFIIVDHVLWNLFLLGSKFPTSGIRGVWFIEIDWVLQFHLIFGMNPNFCLLKYVRLIYVHASSFYYRCLWICDRFHIC